VRGERCDGTAEVHVFRLADDRWVHDASVRPVADGVPIDDFGERQAAVVIGGSRIFVGLPFDGGGSVHVYELRGEVWELANVITAPDGSPDARFADALAVGGEHLYVGASGHEKVYELSLAGWVETSRVEHPQTGSRFGAALAIDGGRLLIGAPSEGNCETGVEPLHYSTDCQVDGVGPGAAFLFERDDEGRWSRALYLQPTTDRFETEFGGSVAMIDDWIVVGAPGEPNNGQGLDAPAQEGPAGTGAVFLFARGP
jgi:hypothetical protein